MQTEFFLKVLILSHLQFSCYNGTTINASQVCDFVADCKDGEDEMDCGDCNFQFSEWPLQLYYHECQGVVACVEDS